MSMDNWSDMPRGYTAEYAECAAGIYWHLYRGEERVNGGISSSRVVAQREVVHYARQHRDVVSPLLSDMRADLLLDYAARGMRRRLP